MFHSVVLLCVVMNTYTNAHVRNHERLASYKHSKVGTVELTIVCALKPPTKVLLILTIICPSIVHACVTLSSKYLGF